MADQAVAAVKTGASKIEMREFPLPDIGPDSALLRIDAAGMCGAYEGYHRELRGDAVIVGHENVGTLVKVGKVFAQRWGVEEGEFIALEEYIPCYHCEWCLMGEYRLCWEVDGFHNPNQTRFGGTPITKEPALWGGYSQYLYLPLNIAFQKMPKSVKPEVAALLLPLSNGVQWGVTEPVIGPDRAVLIQGPGPKGLGCVLAAKISGASNIIISGLSSDTARLDMAKKLGADHVIMADKENMVEKVMEYTDGQGVDGTADCTSTDSPTVTLGALDALKRKGGTMVIQGRPMTDFPFPKLAAKYGQIRITRGHNHASVRTAGDWIASGKYNNLLEMQVTHQFPLAKTDQAMLASGGEGYKDVVSAMVRPWS